MNLILFGFKRCGKTFFGKKVATKLKRSFFDTDQLLKNLFEQMQNKRLSIREIVKELGLGSFRSLENKVIMSLQEVQYSVISVGGGAVLDPFNTELLLKQGTLIYLDPPRAVIKERTLSGELPSYLNPDDPEGSFEIMYNERKPRYDKIPAKRVKTWNKREKDIVLEICTHLEGKHGE